ncbi:MAG: hypothetical protein ACRDNF_19945 [Streptosporangiaceae bacterium]
MLPAVLAAAVTGYLAWGAWVSAHDPHWLYLGHTWWRSWLQPDHDQALLAWLALWCVALACYWRPRRLQPQTVGLTTVVAMGLIGAVLGLASLIPCRGGQSSTAAAAWLLGLYVGNPPSVYQTNSCPGQQPLALQLAEIICLAATLVGALAAAAVLWRQPVDRLRARLVRDAVIFTGLDAMTFPLLSLLSETGRPASIVVIEPDGNHPLLDDARATGARVMIGQPASPRVLLPIIAGGHGCALRHLYALRDDVSENEAILAATMKILDRYRPDTEEQPHLIARIDDPRHADHWRGWHVGTASRCFEDALSAFETTACMLADRIYRTEAAQLLLCGDSTLALAVLRELARRAWERQELVRASATGRAAHPGEVSLDEAARRSLAPLPLRSVLLLDARAADLRREYLATSPPPIAAALPTVRADPRPWEGQLLSLLDDLPPTEAAATVVLITDSLTERGRHEAGRVARLHPDTPLFVPMSAGSGRTGAIFDMLQPFQQAFLVAGKVPEDVWTRVARHWHECYRLSHPPVPGDPRSVTGRPWAELDGFIRQDNILQVRSIMAEVVDQGRQWVPSRAVTPGSFIEFTDGELEEVARAEHARWYQRRLAAGWTAAGNGMAASSAGLVNRRVLAWPELPAADRLASIGYLRSQLARLEDAGFVPIVPEGGPDRASEFHRVGTVRARRLRSSRRWNRRTGDELSGKIGDWSVRDESGDERTVRDAEFRASHEPLGGERWLRTGTYHAWQVSELVVLRTIEGRATAHPGDWVVEGRGGERWPVCDEQFQRTYRRVRGEQNPVTPE